MKSAPDDRGARNRLQIIICDPFDRAGGGEMSQAPLLAVLRGCLSGCDVETLKIAAAPKELKGYLSAFFAGRRLREKIARADLLVLQSPFSLATISLGRKASALGIPYVLIPRGNMLPPLRLFRVSRKPFLKWLLFILFIRPLLSRAAAVVVMSQMEGDRWKAVAKLDHLRVIPNPVLDDGDGNFPHRAKQTREDFPWEENRPFALFLSRISLEKGLDLLLKCWPAVLERCPRAVLLIAGPVDHWRVYRRLVRMRGKLGLGQSVVFSGWVEGCLKRQLLQRARCLLLPSHNESFGNPVPEALKARTPVIASTGTPWQVLEGSAGRWLPRDPGLWAEAIAEYLTPDSKLAVEEAAMNRILEAFRIEKIEEQWREVIVSACGLNNVFEFHG